jgi:hypothetical protein
MAVREGTLTYMDRAGRRAGKGRIPSRAMTRIGGDSINTKSGTPIDS